MGTYLLVRAEGIHFPDVVRSWEAGQCAVDRLLHTLGFPPTGGAGHHLTPHGYSLIRFFAEGHLTMEMYSSSSCDFFLFCARPSLDTAYVLRMISRGFHTETTSFRVMSW